VKLDFALDIPGYPVGTEDVQYPMVPSHERLAPK
jgi:hypothetical protein